MSREDRRSRRARKLERIATRRARGEVIDRTDFADRELRTAVLSGAIQQAPGTPGSVVSPAVGAALASCGSGLASWSQAPRRSVPAPVLASVEGPVVAAEIDACLALVESPSDGVVLAALTRLTRAYRVGVAKLTGELATTQTIAR